jgi:tRNA (pseudouridine54-N1)-methyltransferase
VRRIVVIGQKATASGEFSLLDTPGTSGRLDVLLRCVRAALLVSHGLRQDTLVYLVLLGGPRAPRVLKVDGRTAKFVRPDERSLGTLVQKSLAADIPAAPAGMSAGFVDVRPGISIAEGGLDAALADLGGATLYVLEAGAPDVRTVTCDEDAAFFVGDHLGFDEPTRARLASMGARPIAMGPVDVHADDAIAVLSNELDRRDARI